MFLLGYNYGLEFCVGANIICLVRYQYVLMYQVLVWVGMAGKRGEIGEPTEEKEKAMKVKEAKKLNWQGGRRRCGEEGRGILVGGLGGNSDKEVVATWHRRVVVEGSGGGKRDCMRERENTKRKKKKS